VTTIDKETNCLLRACLEWNPGDRPLRQDERVKAHLQRHPDDEALVWAFQLLRMLGRCGQEVGQTAQPADEPGAIEESS